MLMEDNPHEIGEGIVTCFKAKVASPFPRGDLVHLGRRRNKPYPFLRLLLARWNR
jgi:hypothetical protein